MHFDSLFISSVLLASAVLVHLAGENLSQHVPRRSDDEFYSTMHWTGAALRNEPISVITGTFVVPSASGDPGSQAGLIVSVGIGEDSDLGPCTVIQTGIKLLVTDNVTSYTAFSQWCPNDIVPFTGSDVEVSPEDTVRLEVSVFIDSVEPVATFSVENVSKNTTVFNTISSSFKPYTGMAEWILQPIFTDPYDLGTIRPLAKFNQVTFKNAVALGPGGEKYGSQNAERVEAELLGGYPPRASIDRDTGTIQIVDQHSG